MDWYLVLSVVFVAIAVAGSSATNDVGRPSVPARDDNILALEWIDGPSLGEARAAPAVVVMPDGNILVVGGTAANGPTATTEILDLNVGIWVFGPKMSVARTGHTATLLDDGTVLVTGGLTSTGVTASAEVIDLKLGTSISLPDMYFARSGHAAVLLGSGKVLVTGGSDWATGTWNQAEIYDPASHNWLPAGSMARPRVFFSLLLLEDGSALAVAGDEAGTSEKYDADSNSWSGEANMASTRYSAGVVSIGGGKVLAAGGMLNNAPSAKTELYDSATNTWSEAPDMKVARAQFSLSLLPSGAVLAAGSASGLGTTDSSEVFFPGNSTWVLAEPMKTPRGAHGSAVLPNGSLFVIGGRSGDAVISSVETLGRKAVEPGAPCMPIDLIPLVMEATELPGQSYNGLIAKLLAAQDQYDEGNYSVCLNIMHAFYNQLKAFAQSGHMTEAHAHALYEGYDSVVRCIGGTPDPPIPEMQLLAIISWAISNL